MVMGKDYGVTQKLMSIMSGASVSKISRLLSTLDIFPFDSKSGKKMNYTVHDCRNVLKLLRKKEIEIEKQVQCFYNFKGGVGKTSICFQFVTHLALMGFNVLVIDADPQAHLSTSFGLTPESGYITLYDIITKGISPEESIHPIFEGLDCIPSNLSLTKLEMELNLLPRREEQISFVLESIKKRYDFVVFDTNPTISHLNRNVVTASNLINIVCETQPYSVNGMRILMEDLDKFFKSMLSEIPKINIIPNKYEDRTSSSAESMSALREFYSKWMKSDFAVRKSEDINQGAKLGAPLAFFCKKNSNALEDVLELVYYILDLSSKKTTDLMDAA
jgi:chromosome partitioning protein